MKIAPETQARIIREIDEMEQYREDHLDGYAVQEHYIVRNSHFAEPAEVVVHVEYQRGFGKRYEVLSRSGPSLLKNRIIDGILQEEAIMSRGEVRRQLVLTSANYGFRLLGAEKMNGYTCWALELTPRRKSPHLLRGRVWIDQTSKALVRIEGQPPVGESLWAGRPEVVRDYAVLQGFSLVQHSHATSHGFIQGKTEVDIRYEHYADSEASAARVPKPMHVPERGPMPRREGGDDCG